MAMMQREEFAQWIKVRIRERRALADSARNSWKDGKLSVSEYMDVYNKARASIRQYQGTYAAVINSSEGE